MQQPTRKAASRGCVDTARIAEIRSRRAALFKKAQQKTESQVDRLIAAAFSDIAAELAA